MVKIKIFWSSDSPFTVTGFASQSWNIVNGLAKAGHECHYLAHNYIGQTLPPGVTLQDGTKFNFTIHGTGKEPYMKDMIVPKIREHRPDVFCTLLDTFMVFPWFMDLDLAPAHSMFYYPSDGGGGLPMGCDNILRKVNTPIAMSKFAQQQALETHGVQSLYIPHGVDTKNYYPLKNKEEIKAKFGLQGKFVFGTVARNQGRKMLDRTIKAFSVFAKTHEDAILFMHSDPEDTAAVFHIPTLIKRHGIQNRVRWSGMRAFKGFDYKQMNEVYNAMDCHLLTTSGEGFGVPTIEAAACGIPSIATDYTTTKELLVDEGKCGLPAKLQTEITGSWCVDRGVMDVEDCVKQMELIYSDEKLRKELGRVGRKKAEEIYSWDVIIPQWLKLMESIK